MYDKKMKYENVNHVVREWGGGRMEGVNLLCIISINLYANRIMKPVEIILAGMENDGRVESNQNILQVYMKMSQ
jgi:hypothetical protein